VVRGCLRIFSNYSKRKQDENDLIIVRRKNKFTWFIFSFTLILLLFLLAWPANTKAGKGHEECSLCHGVHTSKGLRIFPKEFNTKTINPNTSEHLGKIDSLCMACHASKPNGEGIRALDLTRKHYFGGKLYVMKLPDAAKDFKGGEDRFTCLACHDPHPSNKNYCYLRTKKGLKISKSKDIKKFCLWCHPKLKFLLKKIF